MAHRSVDRDSRKLSTVAFDYLFFVIREGLYAREGLDETTCGDQRLKILVVRDSKSGSTFARAVLRKRLDDKGFIVRCVADDVAWLGYSRVIPKSDNEPAMVGVLKGTLKAIRVDGIVDQALEEHPPPYDSQSNGLVESVVKSVRGMTRTLQRCVGEQLGLQDPRSACHHDRRDMRPIS